MAKSYKAAVAAAEATCLKTLRRAIEKRDAALAKLSEKYEADLLDLRMAWNEARRPVAEEWEKASNAAHAAYRRAVDAAVEKYGDEEG